MVGLRRRTFSPSEGEGEMLPYLPERCRRYREDDCGTGVCGVTGRSVTRLLRFVLVGAFIAIVVVTTATADSPVCTHGVSSVGPGTLTHGRLRGNTPQD